MRKRRAIAQYNGWWGDSQKLEAVQTYLMLGTIKLTAAALEIPERTLISWRNAPWWQEIVDELRLQDKLQLSSKLKRIVEKTLEQTEDRVTKGDYHFGRDGELVRKPVSLKDLNKVSIDFIDKREAILSTEKVTLSDAKVEEKLKTLAEKFAAYATRTIEKQKAPVEVTDVIFVEDKNALHDKRQEDYKKQYAKYDGKPSVVKDRASRNKARAVMVKAGVVRKGDGKDVDHITPLSKGGARTSRTNLRAVSRSSNRSFARTSNGAVKSVRRKSR